MDRIDIQVNETTAARRRVTFDLRDESDGMTPETGEADGQPQRTYQGVVSLTVTGSLTPDITGTDAFSIHTAAFGSALTYTDSTYFLWYSAELSRWMITDGVGAQSGGDWWENIAGDSGDPTAGTYAAGSFYYEFSGSSSPDADGTYMADGNQHNGQDLYGLIDPDKPAYFLWWDGDDTWVVSLSPGSESGARWQLTNADRDGNNYTAAGGAAGSPEFSEVAATSSGTATLANGSTGMAWTDAGIGVLVEIGNGRYYAELTAAAVDTVGDAIHTRFKSSATAETPGDWVRVVNFDPDNVGEAVFLVDLDQVEAAAPVDSLTCMILMALHSNTRDNAGKITVYRTDDATEFTQLTYTTDATADPIDGVS